MNFLNFEEAKQELIRLYKENKSLKEENDKLAGQSTSYWWKNEELKREIERLAEENKKLKIELEHLKEPKAIINVSITAEDLAKEVARALNKKEEKEHKCTEQCFKAHVLDPIQSDIYNRFGNDIIARSENVGEIVEFVEIWRKRLTKEYSFVKDFYTMNFGELTAVYK